MLAWDLLRLFYKSDLIMQLRAVEGIMKKRNIILAILGLSLLLFGMVSGASALTITPTSTPQWTTDDNSNLNATKIATLVGYSGTLIELYKQDVGHSNDSGPFASSYSTEFFNTSDDPEDATITYVGGSYIINNPLYLYVKDGNQEPAAYVFDISAWDGKETININDFWPGQGAISHVTILGGTTTNVPEPGTLLILGAGLMGIAAVRRARSRRN